jgi:outer membrane protein OmpA-like peptidoglycan-associated protein
LIAEEKRMYSRVSKSVSWILALAFVALIPVTLAAQVTAKPAAEATAEDSASKWDIFLGYSYLAPQGTVTWVGRGGGTHTNTFTAINYGSIYSAARYFDKYVGAQLEVDEHIVNEYPSGAVNGSTSSYDDFSGGSAGLIFRYPSDNVTLFAHALVGVEYAGGIWQPDTFGPVLTVGGGMDFNTPLFDHHLAIRVFQADYQYTHEDFYPYGRGNFNMPRLSAGLVYHIGSFAPPPPVTLACSASPATIFPGDPVTVTATAGNLDPKLNVVYSWTGVPGLKGDGTIASLDSAATGSLAAGSYTVNCGVKEGRPGKEGLRPWESAAATASFTVKAFEPPTISCSSSPSIIKPGETSIVTAMGMSPQNRPLTYSYMAASGTISGTGASATFDSTGAATGAAAITCNITDDKGQTATAATSVTIAPPPPPPGPPAEQVRLEARLALHSVFFPTAQPRASKPEGGLVDSQQATLATLATDFKSYLTYKPDAHLTLSGHCDVRGSVEYNQALSERRVARTKQFLVEQGVPEAKIETLGLGKDQELTADQVKELVEQNPDLSDVERARVLRDLNVIVLAQNRRVDVVLSTTGQESVRLYPFNAADSLTLIQEKSTTPRKKAAAAKK